MAPSSEVDAGALMRHAAAFARWVKLSGTDEEAESLGYVQEQLETFGFRTELLVASQGFLAPFQEKVAELRERDEAAYAALLDMAADTAGDPSVHGLSGHLLYVGSAP